MTHHYFGIKGVSATSSEPMNHQANRSIHRSTLDDERCWVVLGDDSIDRSAKDYKVGLSSSLSVVLCLINITPSINERYDVIVNYEMDTRHYLSATHRHKSFVCYHSLSSTR
jgi:hypothetical protein